MPDKMFDNERWVPYDAGPGLVDRTKLYNQRYREAHPEAIRARSKAYYEAHKEEAKAKQRARYKAHREEILARKRAHYWEHRDEILAKERGREDARKRRLLDEFMEGVGNG